MRCATSCPSTRTTTSLHSSCCPFPTLANCTETPSSSVSYDSEDDETSIGDAWREGPRLIYRNIAVRARSTAIKRAKGGGVRRTGTMCADTQRSTFARLRSSCSCSEMSGLSVGSPEPMCLLRPGRSVSQGMVGGGEGEEKKPQLLRRCGRTHGLRGRAITALFVGTSSVLVWLLTMRSCISPISRR